jgi:flavodoxin
MAQPKILIVYYSRTGMTRAVAELLAAQLLCDIEDITEVTNRTGARGYFQCMREAMFKRGAVIHPPVKDPADYDLVVIGTPVWAWSVAPPVSGYIVANKARLPEVAFFCTLGNTGAERVFAQLRRLTGRSPLGQVAFKTGEVARGRHALPLATFAKLLQTVARTPPISGRPGQAARA